MLGMTSVIVVPSALLVLLVMLVVAIVIAVVTPVAVTSPVVVFGLVAIAGSGPDGRATGPAYAATMPSSAQIAAAAKELVQ